MRKSRRKRRTTAQALVDAYALILAWPNDTNEKTKRGKLQSSAGADRRKRRGDRECEEEERHGRDR